jgi:hypothetical protein
MCGTSARENEMKKTYAVIMASAILLSFGAGRAHAFADVGRHLPYEITYESGKAIHPRNGSSARGDCEIVLICLGKPQFGKLTQWVKPKDGSKTSHLA